MANNFEQVGTQLAGVAAQQQSVAAMARFAQAGLDYTSPPGRAGAGHVGGFGPRPSSAAADIAEDHRRPSYLIEMDDVFADGRKVAPAVIGGDPPGHGGSS